VLEGEAMVDLRDPDSIISEIQDIMSDPNYIPITGPISLINALENAKKIRVNRGTVPIDGSIPTFKYRPGSGGSRGARGDEEIDAMIMEIANNDDIVLTPEMVELINDPELRMTSNREVAKLTGRDVIRRSGQFSRSAILPNLPLDKPKKKRKISKYQKEFGIQLKKLKKKHPRTSVTKLMKRAHTATRKALK
jgi:hypothetical protein